MCLDNTHENEGKAGTQNLESGRDTLSDDILKSPSTVENFLNIKSSKTPRLLI